MEWSITIHEGKYIEVVTSGVADTENSQEMAKVIAKTMRKNRLTKALIDHRNIDRVTGSPVEIYQRPKLFRVIGWVLGIKIAELIKPEHKEHFQFLETVCLNRGFTFSLFYDKSRALNWLLGGT